MQSKWYSFIEANINTFIGFIISFIITYILLPHYGVKQSLSVSLEITMIYTVSSIIRGYLVRRYFNWKLHRSSK